METANLAVMSGLEQIVQRSPARPATAAPAASTHPAQVGGSSLPQLRLQRVA